MTALKNRYKKLAITLGLVSIMAVSAAVPAFAADSVTQSVNAGTRTASIANATLTAVNYSHSAQTNTGSMTLTADDSTGSDLGWNVTVQAGNFVDGTKSIAASNFSITTANAPTVTAGQAIDTLATPAGGPKAGVGGSLDTARKVLLAEAGYGKGTYGQTHNVSLSIPAQTLAGTYVSTLTVSIAAGPGA